jgi:beta-galactosidase
VGTDFDDVVQVRATVVDAAGIRVPRFSGMLRFNINGQAEVVAVDNGDLASHEPFQGTVRSAYDGMAVAYVRGTSNSGRMRVTVSGRDLKSGFVAFWLTGE